MYSDYIVRSQIFDQILERYPEDTFYKSRLKFYQALTIGSDYGQSTASYHEYLQIHISRRGSISLTSQIICPMISPKLCNRFSCWGYPNEIKAKGSPEELECLQHFGRFPLN